MKTGHIRIMINRKIYFEYHELEKPNRDILSAYLIKHGCDTEDIKGLYNEKMKLYEASKQLVEVDIEGSNYILIADNQHCKAEVKDDKATIVELIK